MDTRWYEFFFVLLFLNVIVLFLESDFIQHQTRSEILNQKQQSSKLNCEQGPVKENPNTLIRKPKYIDQSNMLSESEGFALSIG